MSAPLLTLKDVNSFYGESHILHDVSFDLNAGDIVGLLGRNGVGKTTTLQTILGVPAPRTGEIRFHGELLSGRRTSEIVRQGIGWVPQGHRIFASLSVTENLDLAAARARPGPWTLQKIYQRFPRLEVRRNARGDSLSGGEQQMLAIARALIQNPSLFLMDEPSEGLSPLIVQEVGSLIRELNEQGVSILLVEQNLNFALEVAHRLLIMNKGAIVYTGTPKEVEANPDVTHNFLGVGKVASDEPVGGTAH